ncbi:MAG: KOW domain-containing RNA-binding protein [Lachnospiraceae bacterium]|nr:KOW domain-containing RNA-binding protein [Lachnospiraceae bacterium]
MIGMLAFSKAGHDKQAVYMITGEEEEYVYVSDGKRRPIENPKRKNKKHIQPVKKGFDASVGERIKSGLPVRNEEIKKVIKDFMCKEDADV